VTPLDEFVMVSPKHGKTTTTITGNDTDKADRSRGSSRSRSFRGEMPDKITQMFLVEYNETDAGADADTERQHGFTPLPRR
jgi:hypothetical protein